MKRKIVIALVLLFVAIQLIPVELNQSETISKDDFITTLNPPKEIATMLQTSCYDCHSNNTNYPWYDKIAPVSFFVKYHIDEAKEELNFSEWNTFSDKRKKYKLKEIVEETEEGEMPLKAYTIMHGNAKLSLEQRDQLKKWIHTIK